MRIDSGRRSKCRSYKNHFNFNLIKRLNGVWIREKVHRYTQTHIVHACIYASTNIASVVNSHNPTRGAMPRQYLFIHDNHFLVLQKYPPMHPIQIVIYKIHEKCVHKTEWNGKRKCWTNVRRTKSNRKKTQKWKKRPSIQLNSTLESWLSIVIRIDWNMQRTQTKRGDSQLCTDLSLAHRR